MSLQKTFDFCVPLLLLQLAGMLICRPAAGHESAECEIELWPTFSDKFVKPHSQASERSRNR